MEPSPQVALRQREARPGFEQHWVRRSGPGPRGRSERDNHLLMSLESARKDRASIIEANSRLRYIGRHPGRGVLGMMPSWKPDRIAGFPRIGAEVFELVSVLFGRPLGGLFSAYCLAGRLSAWGDF